MKKLKHKPKKKIAPKKKKPLKKRSWGDKMK